MLARRFVCLAFLCSLACCKIGLAIEEQQVKRFLDREILGSETTLAEVQIFTERRVPTMPYVESAQQWTEIASKIRNDVLENVVFRGEASRWKQLETRVEWLDEIDGGAGYKIRKLRYEAVPGLWIPALLYEPAEISGKVPVIMNVNGHDRADGKAADYKQTRCINQARRGMIALNVEWVGMGQLNSPGMSHYAMNQLDLCGTSGLAPFYLSMSRGLDVLLQHPHADPDRVGVAGLSGGGWQTIVISSLDTRVALANPVAGYSSFITRARHFKDLGDSEQTPTDLAVYADYTHLTAMLAPRSALLTFNATDNCCFEATYALEPLMQAAKPKYKLFDQQHRLRSHVNVDPGTHNFLQDNREALYEMLGESFYASDDSFAVKEFDCEDELKTKDELHVALSDGNATFNSIAADLCKSLPKVADLPSELAGAKRWQQEHRETLNQIIRSDRAKYHLQAELQDAYSRDSVQVAHWRLRIGGDWTVPATEITPPEADSTVIVIGDEGRAGCAATVARLINENKRVLAIDPFYFGEAQVSQKDFLFAFMIATVGHRPLGVQANQVAAVARWSRSTHADHPVTLIAEGPRTSLIALVSAAIEADAIAGARLHDSLGSLKELIEKNQLANQTPEMFCFGLLEHFDILQLATLSAPRKISFLEPSDRARSELEKLKKWYKTFGRDHDPLGIVER
jgi:hypothetical protein